MSYLKKMPGMVLGVTSRDWDVAAYWFVNIDLESRPDLGLGMCWTIPSLSRCVSGVRSRVAG